MRLIVGNLLNTQLTNLIHGAHPRFAFLVTPYRLFLEKLPALCGFSVS